MGKENFMICHDLETYITNANNTLLYRKFDKCLKICENGLHFALRYPEVKIANEATETLCTVALQAFVECGRWQEAVPFVGRMYGGFENCPAQIIQYSMLLHANMQDWSTCSGLANVWLRTTQTTTVQEYACVVELYLTNVLEPQERWEDVPAFVESCKSLPADIMATLLQESRARKLNFMAARLQQEDDDDVTVHDNDEIIVPLPTTKPTLPPITQHTDVVDILASHLTTAFQWFVQCVRRPSRKAYSYGALCLLLFYLLVRKTRLGSLPNTLLAAVLRRAVQLCTYCLRLLHFV